MGFGASLTCQSCYPVPFLFDVADVLPALHVLGLHLLSLLTLSGATFQTQGNTTSTRPISITNGTSNTFDTQSFTFTTSNLSPGTTNNFTKIGSGTMAISSPLAFTGPFTVSVGTLSLGGGSSFTLAGTNSAASVALGSFTLTTGADNTSTTFAGSITGQGALVKTGTGTFTLSGTNFYTGSTTISAGTLVVNGSLFSPVTVNGGTLLKGTGTITAPVTVSGTISPGNSIGTMGIVGNLTLNPSSTTNIEINPSQTSALQVTGTASLGGTLNFTLDAGTYSTQTLTFLTTTKGLSGTFSATNFSPFLPPNILATVNYTSNSAQLVLLNLNQTKAGLNASQASILKALAQMTNVSGVSTILADLLALPQSSLVNAINSISPGRNGSSTFLVQNTGFDMGGISSTRMGENRVIDRMISGNRSQRKMAQHFAEKQQMLTANNSGEEDLFANTNAPAGNTKTMAAPLQSCSIWVTGIGDWITQNGQNQLPNITGKAFGGILGFDYLRDWGSMTVSGGYLQTQIDESGHAGSGMTRTGVASVYATGIFNSFYLELGLLGSCNWIENHRQVNVPAASSSFTPFSATARSSHHAWQIMPHLSFGFDALFDWGVIEPFASIDDSILMDQSFSENGAGILNTTQNSQTLSMLRSEVGVRFYESVDTNEACPKEGSLWILKETVSYVNKLPIETNRTGYFTLAATTGGVPSSFTVNGYGNDLNLFSPAFELFFKNKRSGVYFSLLYVGEFGSSYRSTDVQLTLGAFF